MPTHAAALVNGTINHALDYDDTHFACIGRLSPGAFPTAMTPFRPMMDQSAVLTVSFWIRSMRLNGWTSAN
ncbi:MAG: hypothetical protein QNK95_12625 [Paracoccaceae bacterium]